MLFSSLYLGVTLGLWQALQGNIYLENGVSAWQLGAIFATFGLSAALFEIPLGTIADNYGRLKIYRLSLLVKLFSIAILFWGYGLWLMLLFALMAGLSQAIETGSLDAWFVEELKRQNKDEKLQQYQSNMQVATLFSMVLFAFSAGYIPTFLDTLNITETIHGTKWIVLIILLWEASYILLTFWFFQEGEVVCKAKERPGIRKTFWRAVDNIKDSCIIQEMLLFSIVLMVMVSFLEAYWQPRIYEILPNTDYKIFGWITAGLFLTQLIGAVVASLLSSIQKLSPLWLVRTAMLFAVCNFTILSFMAQISGFVVFYFAFILLPTMTQPISFAIVSHETNDENRSTLISIQSFIISLIIGIELLLVPYLVKGMGIASTLGVISLLASLLVLMILWQYRKNRYPANQHHE